MSSAASAALPQLALILSSAFLFCVLVLVLRRVKDRTARFVVVALWLRFMMGAYHHITYQPLLGGLSVNAIASVLVVAIGVWVVAPRGWLLLALAPVYAIVVSIVLSGVLNRAYLDLVNASVKWGYYCVVLLGSYQAIRRIGERRFAGALLGAFAAPVLLQWLSLALGVSKLASEDGGRSYIGGYEHEAAFSVVLVAGLWASAWVRARVVWRLALAGLFLAGLLLAGYRTTLIAAVPLAAVLASRSIAGAFPQRERGAVGAMAFLVCALVAGVGGYLLRERFADFAIIASDEHLLREPEAYTPAERELLSARLYLWSQYTYAWSAGGLKQFLFGFGPESWAGQFSTYAHNTAISTLYELGVLGLCAVLALWGYMISLVSRVENSQIRLVLIGGHVSFFLVNMATMGHWLLEGLILYALVCAFTAARAYAPRAVAQRGSVVWRPVHRLASLKP